MNMGDLEKLYVKAFEESDPLAGREVIDALRARFNWAIVAVTEDDARAVWQNKAQVGWNKEIWGKIRDTQSWLDLEDIMLGSASDCLDDSVADVLEEGVDDDMPLEHNDETEVFP